MKTIKLITYTILFCLFGERFEYNFWRAVEAKKGKFVYLARNLYNYKRLTAAYTVGGKK